MAERRAGSGRDGSSGAARSRDESGSISQTSKRRSSSPCSPDAAPPHKSPRPEAAEGPEQPQQQPQQPQDAMEEATSPSAAPPARRKSWRRATITRRSLPALPNPYQVLCRNISTSLPQQRRLEQLMEDAMKLAVDRLQNSLQSVPNSSSETFQNQMEKLQTEWKSVATSFSGEAPSPQRCIDPALQTAVEKVKTAISRLQAESESWESLLNKHRSRAEQLQRQLAEGERKVMWSDGSLLARSSQFQLIQRKPDYGALLSRQQPRLHTMAIIMDSQAKMLRELLSIKEHSQLMVRETSHRLAAEAGLQDLSPELARNLMKAPLSSAAT